MKILLLNHAPQAYDSARALRLCGPSAHYYHTENCALQPDEQLHAPAHVPPSGLLASLHLLVRGLFPATTRRTGEEEERKGEGEGEGRKQAGSTQSSKLPSGGQWG